MNTAVSKSPPDELPELGENIKRLRSARGWNLSELARFSGLPQSTLSKVEGGHMSLNYPKLLQLARALGADIRSLFATPSELAAAQEGLARRAVDHGREDWGGEDHYRYRYLSTALTNRLMIPILFEVEHAPMPLPMMDLRGERFAYVLEGPVEFHCAQYEPLTLETDDSIYVDAAMPHAFVAPEGRVARVVTVVTSSDHTYIDLARDAAERGESDASQRYLKRNVKAP